MSISPVTISHSMTIRLEPGCKMLLQANILYAEEEEEASLEPVLFSWKWNVTSVFPEILLSDFSKAMQTMHDFGLHTIKANDLIQHLRTQNIAEQIPDFLSGLLQNPFNYSSGLISIACVVFGLYLLIKCIRTSSNNVKPSAPPVQFIYPNQHLQHP